VPKKPKLPGAADFFKATAEADSEAAAKQTRKAASDGAEEATAAEATPANAEPAAEATRPDISGSVPHGLSAQQIQVAQTASPARSLAQPATEKVTFYIPPQMLQQLEVCRVRLLTEQGLKANRSQIAQAAIALTVNDPPLIGETLVQLAQVWGEAAEE